MRDGRIPRQNQILNLTELSRHLIFLFNFHICEVLDEETIKRNHRIRVLLNDAVFYLVNSLLMRNKWYRISFSPFERFKEICLVILSLRSVEEPENYLDDDTLHRVIDYFCIQLEGRLDVGDNYDYFGFRYQNKTFLTVVYKGDYRILVFEHLSRHDEHFELELTVEVNEDKTLLEQYRERDKRILQATRGTRRSKRLSF